MISMASAKTSEQKGKPVDPNIHVLNRTCDLIRATEFGQVIETSESMEVVHKLTELAATDVMRTFKPTHWFNKRPEIVYASSVDEMRAYRLIPRERVRERPALKSSTNSLK